MANNSNPYESPQPVPTESSLASQVAIARTYAFWLSLILLLIFAALAILHVSPKGIVLPAAIGFLVAIKVGASRSAFILCPLLAYAVGISAIVLVHICVDLIYTDSVTKYQDDEWRVQVMRVHAGCGILGAVFGSVIGLIAGRSTPAHKETEPCDATEPGLQDFTNGKSNVPAR